MCRQAGALKMKLQRTPWRELAGRSELCEQESAPPGGSLLWHRSGRGSGGRRQVATARGHRVSVVYKWQPALKRLLTSAVAVEPWFFLASASVDVPKPLFVFLLRKSRLGVSILLW